MNKKVVVLGGGTGLSFLLRGLKQFPVDITAIVSVCDDGRSTGRLRSEFNLPAMGDLRQVLISLSETEPVVGKLLNYRFKTTSDLNGHPVGNLLLTAAAFHDSGRAGADNNSKHAEASAINTEDVNSGLESSLRLNSMICLCCLSCPVLPLRITKPP